MQSAALERRASAAAGGTSLEVCALVDCGNRGRVLDSLLFCAIALATAGCARNDEVRPKKVAAQLDLSTYGVVQARESDAYFSPIRGEAAKLLWLAEEGSTVAPGQELCRLDAYDVETRLRSETLALAQLRENLIVLEQEERTKGARLSTDEVALAAEVEIARGELARFQSIEIPARLAELEIDGDLKGQALVEANRKVEVLETFRERGYASVAELERARLEAQMARSAAEAARMRLEAFQEGGLQAELARKEVQLTRLESDLADVRERRASDAPATQARVENLRVALETAERSVADLRDQIERSLVRARAPGTLVYGEVRDADGSARPIRVGDLVWSNVVLVRVSNLAQQDFVVRAPEQHARLFEAGQKAEVRLSADASVSITGRVRRVSSVTADSESGVRSLEVKLALSNTPEWVRPGMTGRARIGLNLRADAVLVPEQAITLTGGRTFVRERSWLWRTREREVQVVAETEGGVAIVGLEPRARLVVADEEY